MCRSNRVNWGDRFGWQRRTYLLNSNHRFLFILFFARYFHALFVCAIWLCVAVVNTEFKFGELFVLCIQFPPHAHTHTCTREKVNVRWQIDRDRCTPPRTSIRFLFGFVFSFQNFYARGLDRDESMTNYYSFFQCDFETEPFQVMTVFILNDECAMSQDCVYWRIRICRAWNVNIHIICFLLAWKCVAFFFSFFIFYISRT